MELEKSSNSDKPMSNKIYIDCSDPSFFRLHSFLVETKNPSTLILNAMYANNISVVLKFNYPQYAVNEFDMSVRLENLPNYIKFFCMFECGESLRNILLNKNDLSNYEICKVQGKNVGVLVMKYYLLGSVESYTWNEDNFSVLKNVMLQVIYASLYAYSLCKFVHGNLYSRNVLLEPKMYPDMNIYYGSKFLTIDTYQAIIMDFEKSTTEQKPREFMLDGIVKFILLTFQSLKFFVVCDNARLYDTKFIDGNDFDYYQEFYEIINQASIRVKNNF